MYLCRGDHRIERMHITASILMREQQHHFRWTTIKSQNFPGCVRTSVKSPRLFLTTFHRHLRAGPTYAGDSDAVTYFRCDARRMSKMGMVWRRENHHTILHHPCFCFLHPALLLILCCAWPTTVTRGGRKHSQRA